MERIAPDGLEQLTGRGLSDWRLRELGIRPIVCFTTVVVLPHELV